MMAVLLKDLVGIARPRRGCLPVEISTSLEEASEVHVKGGVSRECIPGLFYS